MPKFRTPKLVKSGLRRLVRPVTVASTLTYAARAFHNKATFVESNHKLLGTGIVTVAAILLGVKKARRWLNSDEPRVGSDDAENALHRPASVSAAAPIVTALPSGSGDSSVTERASVSLASATSSPHEAALAAAATSGATALQAPLSVEPSFSAEPRSLRRDASFLDLARYGESAFGVSEDLLEAAVGIGAGILAPMPSFLK